jgi:hypothetical protein
MPRDQEAVKDEAVAELGAALRNAVGIPEALRACWYRNPVFSSALFIEAVRARFGEKSDIRAITRFLTRIREPGFPYREAEAVMRAALGETSLFEYVHPAQLSYPEIGIAVLGVLFQERRPGCAEVERMFHRVEEVLVDMHVTSPGLALAEDDWFVAGMHESPFANPIGEEPMQIDRER